MQWEESVDCVCACDSMQSAKNTQIYPITTTLVTFHSTLWAIWVKWCTLQCTLGYSQNDTLHITGVLILDKRCSMWQTGKSAVYMSKTPSCTVFNTLVYHSSNPHSMIYYIPLCNVFIFFHFFCLECRAEFDINHEYTASEMSMCCRGKQWNQSTYSCNGITEIQQCMFVLYRRQEFQGFI